jgi:hypothetical protein
MPDAPPTVRLVKNELGRGAANALRAGFAAASGNVVVTTMADLSDPPEVIPAMAEKVRRENAVVVSGSRYMAGGSQSGGPWIKSSLSRAACLLLHWVAGVGTHDATTNFKAYSREFLARTPVESTGAFDIALELTVKAHLAGELVGEVPSSWIERSHGASRFRVWAWAPQYLRWWARAMLQPAIVWTLALALGVWSWMRASSLDAGAINALAAALLATALGLAWILAARAARRRMLVVDALHAALWTCPVPDVLARPSIGAIEVGVSVLASCALLYLTVERVRLTAWLKALRGAG